MDILYSATAASMNITKVDLKPYSGNLIEFSGKQMPVEDTVRLRVTLGMWHLIVNMNIDFLIVNAPNNAYNTILERTSLNEARVIILTPHLLMEFPTPCRICQVRADQVATRRRYMANLQNLP